MVIVAAAGQTILTTAGMLSGWTSSMLIVSAPLIGPRAKGVVGCLGKAEPHFRLGPVSERPSPDGPARLSRGYFAPQRSQVCCETRSDAQRWVSICPFRAVLRVKWGLTRPQ